MLISDKFSCGEKSYNLFIGYMDHNCKIKSVSIILPKTSACSKSYDGKTKWMYILIKDDALLKKTH